MRALRAEHSASRVALEAMDQSFDPGWGWASWSARGWAMAFVLAQAGRLHEAQALTAEGVRLVETLDHDSGRAFVYLGAAQVESVLGNLEAAVAHARLGLAAAQRSGSRGRMGALMADLACYLCELGQLDEALQLARAAVDLRSLDGSLWLQLDQLAWLACARGRLREAARSRACPRPGRAAQPLARRPA